MLAAQNYHSAAKKFPSGGDIQQAGVLVYLMPYMEQQAVFNGYSFRPSLYPLYYQDPVNRPASTSAASPPRPPNLYGTEPTIATLLCPAAPQVYVTALLAVSYGDAGFDFNASANANSHTFSSCPGCNVVGRTNYLGMGGYYGPHYENNFARGIFTYNRTVSIPKIADGTSNTIAFAEYVGAWIYWGGSGGIPDGVCGAHWSTGFNYSGFGGPSLTGSQPYNSGSNGNYAQFGSDHPGNIINVAYADGSIRSVTPQINFTTWVYLTGYDDGVVIQVDP
jgi:prepilin-type processing-associated H-X9-DG protein